MSSKWPSLRQVHVLRGGATADYAGAAAELFNNMRAPAALVGGSIVPIGFAAVPEISASDSKAVKKLKQLHMLLAIVSLSAEIVSVIYSTIAINKLSETTVKPAESVTALLRRDYELAWLGANISFLAGLFGFATLLGLRAWFSFGSRLGKIGMSTVLSVLLHSISVVNRGIQAGDGEGTLFAANFLGLVRRYVMLLFADAVRHKSLISALSFFAFVFAVVGYTKLLADPDA